MDFSYVLFLLFAVNSPGNAGVEIRTHDIPMQSLAVCQHAAEIIEESDNLSILFRQTGARLQSDASNSRMEVAATCLPVTQ